MKTVIASAAKQSDRRDCFVVATLLLAMTFGGSFALAAPSASSVQVKAHVLKNKIKIGDELRLLVQVEHPRKFSVTPPSEKINVAPFEVKQADATVLHKGQNRVEDTFGFTLTVFELGDLQIPPIPIRYQDESGNLKEVRTEPIPIQVLTVGKKLTDKEDIRPIKGPVSVGLLRFRNRLLGILAACLFIYLAITTGVRWSRRRKDLESLKPPHVRVQIELGRLKGQGLLEERKEKEYYSGLSDILRNYMERALKFEAHERTTSEILEEMKEKRFDPAVLEKARNVLEDTDLVKFAKLVPERRMADRIESDILSVVEMTRPAQEKK